MAVMIKGMEMPKNCVDCRMEVYNTCLVTDNAVESLDRPSWCPLVEVKEPKRGDTELLEASNFEL